MLSDYRAERGKKKKVIKIPCILSRKKEPPALLTEIYRSILCNITEVYIVVGLQVNLNNTFQIVLDAFKKNKTKQTPSPYGPTPTDVCDLIFLKFHVIITSSWIQFQQSRVFCSVSHGTSEAPIQQCWPLSAQGAIHTVIRLKFKISFFMHLPV